MDMKQFLIIALSCLAVFTSCDTASNKMKARCEEYIVSSLDKPDSYREIAISPPDSAFGKNYLTSGEGFAITKTVMKVNSILLKKRQQSKDGKYDAAIISLAKRQMLTGADLIRCGIPENSKKEDWSGWRVKVDYEFKDAEGIECRSERWFYFNKNGDRIENTFEIVLP